MTAPGVFHAVLLASRGLRRRLLPRLQRAAHQWAMALGAQTVVLARLARHKGLPIKVRRLRKGSLVVQAARPVQWLRRPPCVKPIRTDHVPPLFRDMLQITLEEIINGKVHGAAGRLTALWIKPVIVIRHLYFLPSNVRHRPH